MTGVQSSPNINVRRDSLLCDQVKYWGKSNLQRKPENEHGQAPNQRDARSILCDPLLVAVLHGGAAQGSRQHQGQCTHAPATPTLPLPRLSVDPHKCCLGSTAAWIRICVLANMSLPRRTASDAKKTKNKTKNLNIWYMYIYIYGNVSDIYIKNVHDFCSGKLTTDKWWPIKITLLVTLLAMAFLDYC